MAIADGWTTGGSRTALLGLRQGPISRRLLALSRSLKRQRVEIGEVIDGLGPEGLGLALLVLTLPALIPLPGPFGMVFGSFVLLVACQMLFGAQRFWLPARLRNQRLSQPMARRLIAQALPWIGRAESVLRESRLHALTGRVARIACALPILLMAVAIMLPIPLGNFAPALALVFIAIGFTARDGLAVLAGLSTSLLALGWTFFLILFGAAALEWAAQGWAL
jgi:hypothetical protein